MSSFQNRWGNQSFSDLPPKYKREGTSECFLPPPPRLLLSLEYVKLGNYITYPLLRVRVRVCVCGLQQRLGEKNMSK